MPVTSLLGALKAKSCGFYHYDPHTNAYESLGQLPLERWFGFAVAAHEGVLYVIGGIVDGRWTGRAFAYHVAERAWEEIPSMSYVRRRTAALCVDVPCITSV
jgi:N-acetylneuraminic acid mutarotase